MKTRKPLLYLVVCLCLITVWLLSGGQYDWVNEFDPSVDAGQFEDASGDSGVFSTAVTLIALACLGVLGWRAQTLVEKGFCAGLAVLALALLY